jgi:hypothetical protein
MLSPAGSRDPVRVWSLAEEEEFGERDLRVRAPDRGRLAQAPHLGRLPRRHGGDPGVVGGVSERPGARRCAGKP